MSPAPGPSDSKKLIIEGLWRNNPIFKQVLGICSTLAVTNLVLNTAVMCLALVFTLSLSSATVSLLRTFTPRNIRMMVETLIIAFYVIVVDVLLKAYWPEMSGNLGPYVGLIITNCIIMGRLEAFALANKPWPSFLDGLGNGAGYGLILIIVAFFRELLGSGSVLGYNVVEKIGLDKIGYENNGLMVLSPMALITVGIIICIHRSRDRSLIEEK